MKSRNIQKHPSNTITHTSQPFFGAKSQAFFSPSQTVQKTKLFTKNGDRTIQRNGGYSKLKKTEDPEVIWHKKFGKEVVATYRILDKVTQAMAAGKNRQALMSAAVGLAKAGLSIGLMLTGIPSLTEGSDALAGEIVLNTGADSLGQQAGKTGAGIGIDELAPAPVNPDVEKGIKKTTIGGAIGSKIHDKVGTLNNAAKTLLGFIPFFGAAKSLAKGLRQGAQSKDDWNEQKGTLFRCIREIEAAMGDAISEVDVAAFGDLEIVTANKKVFLNRSRRTLESVLVKYKEKSAALRKVCDAWSEKHEEHVGFLTPELDDDDSGLEIL